MGVDYYACSHCGDTFPDAGYHVSCECGKHWDSDECAESDGFRSEELDDYEEIRTCSYCRNEEFEDYELLLYAINLLGIERDELVRMYRSHIRTK